MFKNSSRVVVDRSYYKTTAAAKTPLIIQFIDILRKLKQIKVLLKLLKTKQTFFYNRHIFSSHKL